MKLVLFINRKYIASAVLILLAQSGMAARDSEKRMELAGEAVRLISTEPEMISGTPGGEPLYKAPVAHWSSALIGIGAAAALLPFYRRICAKSFGSVSGPLVMGAS